MCKYTDALEKLDAVELKWSNAETSGEVSIEKANIWQVVSDDIYSNGILFTPFTNSNKDVVEGISFLPKNSLVSEHIHKYQEEEFRVLTGELHYKVYTDKRGRKGKLLREGSIKKWESLVIKSKEYHFVFTTEYDTYLYTKLTNVSKETLYDEQKNNEFI